jgi:hypothetical protein
MRLYKIGLIADGIAVGKQYAALLDWAAGQGDVEICALVVQDVPSRKGRGLGRVRAVFGRFGLYAAISRALFLVLSKLESAVTPGLFLDELRLVKIGHLIARHLSVTPIVAQAGSVYRYSDGDVDRIAALELDVLVRCGSGILKGGILKAAKHGVISIHHGDNRVNRGGPPGFWEVRNKEPETGFVIQRLSEEVESGQVLLRGTIPTESSYLRNRATISARSAVHLQNALRRLFDGRSRMEEPHIYCHPHYRSPMLGDVLHYVLQTGSLLVKMKWRRFLGIRNRWQVAVLKGDWRDAVLWRATEIKNEKGRFLADPFAIREGGRNYIFAEEYRVGREQGTIVAYGEAETGYRRLGVAIDEDSHLSFPFLFRYGGEIFMCPETASYRQIRLYRCTGFPLKWELHAVLMDDVRAFDTIIFERDGRWWLMTTINQTGLGRPCELHIFHSDNPLGGWQPLADNPVLIDARRGRNGGFLTAGSDIFRVSQRPGFGIYGRRFAIHKIARLDLDGYEETQVQEVVPAFKPGIAGTHHIHHADGVTVFDFMRRERTTSRR